MLRSLNLQLFTDVSGQPAKYTLRNIPEERRSHLHHGGSLKSRIYEIFIVCGSVSRRGEVRPEIQSVYVNAKHSLVQSTEHVQTCPYVLYSTATLPCDVGSYTYKLKF
jgi:hypothetical protein